MTTAEIKKANNNELATALDTAAEELKNAWLTEGNFSRTISYGLAVGKMREALNDKVMASLVKLKNCKLGFRTDESNGNVYPIDVVRDCIIDAATLGLQCVGNQFNIIGANMYVTKEGFTYLLRELARSGRLRDMKLVYSPAVITESSTQGTRRDGSSYQKIEREGKIKVDLSWTFDGKAGSEILEFCVRVNAGMSQDAIIGKAERKAKAWLYNYLTDQAISDGEYEAEEASTAQYRDVTKKASESTFLTRAAEAGPIGLPKVVEPELPDELPDEIPGLEPANELPMFGEMM